MIAPAMPRPADVRASVSVALFLARAHAVQIAKSDPTWREVELIADACRAFLLFKASKELPPAPSIIIPFPRQQ